MANTLFKKIDYTLSSLVDEIANGQLALPDIQRLAPSSPDRPAVVWSCVWPGWC